MNGIGYRLHINKTLRYETLIGSEIGRVPPRLFYCFQYSNSLDKMEFVESNSSYYLLNSHSYVTYECER